MSTPVGVLVMAYGTPGMPEGVEAYYTHVRRGRPPPPDLLADLVGRYAAIGGTSPLAQRSAAQAGALQDALDDAEPGHYRVGLGFKHAAPFIEDAVDDLVAGGARRLVGLVLAPHYSAASVGQYLYRARTAAGPATPVTAVESWHLEPAYLDFLAAEVFAGLARLPPGAKVLFTAHSLPVRVLDDGDPYADQVRRTATEVAARAGLVAWTGWAVAWQSAGRTPEPWLGPDVTAVIRDLAALSPAGGVLVCPCGFVSDHLEVLYDLDIEARQVAGGAGLAFARTALPNAEPTVLGALAQRVRRAATRVR